jgi:hypothetical protein
MAVLWQGAVLFHGQPGELVERVRDKVWTILAPDGECPDGDLVVVSSRQATGGVQHRILGIPPASYGATAVEPRLEDGYMWLMHQARATAG